MMVAGEASGDKHGAALALALKSALGDRELRLFGSGGEEMRAAGVETLVDARELGIIGILEIARALPKFFRAYGRLVSAALARRPNAVVLIDWPDFNLRLARRLHREGFKVVYYISPQVWAWRKYRVRAIRRSVERMLVILPFEEEFYRQEGVAAEYVGHPLSGAVRITSSREEFAQRHGLDADRAIVAMLPGSRQKELHYHLPIMAQAAERLMRSGVDWRLPSGEQRSAGSGKAGTLTHGCAGPREAGLREEGGQRREMARASISADDAPQFVVPLASTVDRAEVEALLGPALDRMLIVERDTYNALGHALAAVVASGTATVEAALLGIPMVVVYRGSELNWRLIRPLIRLDTFGMVNLIAGRRIVPELIQHEATPERIVNEMVSILAHQSRFAQMKKDLEMVSARLSFEGASPPELAARRVIDLALGQG